MALVTVEVLANRVKIPRRCTCCGVLVLDYATGICVGKGWPAPQWRLPCCEHCLDHDRIWKPTGHVVADLFVAWLVAAGIGLTSTSAAVVLGTVASVVVLASARHRRTRARDLMTSDCVRPHQPVLFLGGDHTTLDFAFASEAYAAAFVRANLRSLVNVASRVPPPVAVAWDRPAANGNVPLRTSVVDER